MSTPTENLSIVQVFNSSNFIIFIFKNLYHSFLFIETKMSNSMQSIGLLLPILLPIINQTNLKIFVFLMFEFFIDELPLTYVHQK